MICTKKIKINNMMIRSKKGQGHGGGEDHDMKE